MYVDHSFQKIDAAPAVGSASQGRSASDSMLKKEGTTTDLHQPASITKSAASHGSSPDITIRKL
jgi:hypothetical protein